MNADFCSRRLRVDLAYDGTDFHGWASQPGLCTVQGEVTAAIASLLNVSESEVRLTVGGRTDAGVHARGQVAHLDVSERSFERWSRNRGGVCNVDQLRARRLNGVLRGGFGVRRGGVRGAGVTPDIVVRSVREVPGVFDARFGALRRRYEYRLRSGGVDRDPLSARFTCELPFRLDVEAMRRVSQKLLGLHDFSTFCQAREGATSVRELQCFQWCLTDDGVFAARIEADAFCHGMVRALVGGVVAVGSGRLEEDELLRLRDARERTSRFTVMPAHGLSLEEIVYPPDDELAVRAEQTRAVRCGQV